MKGISHVFFDLDHTLWDYDFNATKVLSDLYDHFRLQEVLRTSKEGFIKTFFSINANIWRDYNQGKIEKEYIRNERFGRIMRHCGAEDTTISHRLSDYFLYYCPRQPKLMEEVDVVLPFLSKKYKLGIITNGFSDVQDTKLTSSGIRKYFEVIVTSESIGSRKPSREIFDHALELAGIESHQAVMIGDNPGTDILGAKNAGWVPILYDPKFTMKSDCEWQVQRFSELMKIL